jgi:hypothetical protein
MEDIYGRTFVRLMGRRRMCGYDAVERTLPLKLPGPVFGQAT